MSCSPAAPTPGRILGLTGFACAGKSAAAGILARLGAEVIDLDRLGHEALLLPAVEARLRDLFGDGIFNAEGRIERKALGAVVFADPQALQQLEAVVHPLMCAVARDRAQAAAAAGKTVVLDAAILYRLGLDALCSAVIVLDAPFDLRLKRAAPRNWTAEVLQARDEAYRARLPVKTINQVTVNNSGELPQLEDSLTSLWKELQHGKTPQETR